MVVAVSGCADAAPPAPPAPVAAVVDADDSPAPASGLPAERDGPPTATVTPRPTHTSVVTASPSPTRRPTDLPTATAQATEIGEREVASPTPEATSAPIATPTPEREATPEPEATDIPTPEPTAAPVAAAPPISNLAAYAGPGVPAWIEAGSVGLGTPLVAVGLDAYGVPIVPDHDAAWYSLSGLPGMGENVVLWGHVLRFQSAPELPAPFERVKDLGVGSTLTLYTGDGVAHRYVVSQQVWATPDEVHYILPQGYERLTLVSCIGDAVITNGSVVDMSHRLITIATPLR
ncbi:MAG: sortase [Chloroflexaceae bacterium]|nr:sortase [Chloroflexaceae bacterium]